MIFKRFPDEAAYTEERKYKSILLTTNYRRGCNAFMPIIGINKGYKYKHVITSLVSDKIDGKKRTSAIIISSTMKLTNDKIDYVHWNLNELVDHLRLLDASRQAITRSCLFWRSFAKQE